MAKKKIEIQDSDGNIYYPHTSLDAVFDNDGKSAKKLLDDKVDKIPGKVLSTYDFSRYYKDKIEGIEQGANKYVHPDEHPATMISGLHAIATSGNYNDLKYTPNIPGVYDCLTSSKASDALSANQGRILKGLIDNLDAEVLKNNKVIQNSNFDDITTPGLYTINSCSNAPNKLISYWSLIVLNSYTTNYTKYTHQVALEHGTNNIYVRYYTAGKWAEWASILTGLKVAYGIYIGDETQEKFVQVGFRPKLVIICGSENDDTLMNLFSAFAIAIADAPYGLVWQGNDNKMSLAKKESGEIPFKYSDTGFYVKDIFKTSDTGQEIAIINNLNWKSKYHYFCIG